VIGECCVSGGGLTYFLTYFLTYLLSYLRSFFLTYFLTFLLTFLLTYLLSFFLLLFSYTCSFSLVVVTKILLSSSCLYFVCMTLYFIAPLYVNRVVLAYPVKQNTRLFENNMFFIDTHTMTSMFH